MKITVEMERKIAGSTLAEWEEFLTQARRIGASDDTNVDEQVDESMSLEGWSVTVEQGASSPMPESVSLPTRTVHNVLFVLTSLADGDGDARNLLGPAKETLDQINEYLRRPALGPSPWNSDDD